MSRDHASISELSERSREIFRYIVDAYMETGEPVGSRTLSRRLGLGLSPATIRNVMADLEDVGLLYAPHVSAGRLPTEKGLRLFVHGLLQVGAVSEDDRVHIDSHCKANGTSVADALDQASAMLSGLSRCAGLVVAPKVESPLKHIEFVNLGPGRALVVMVSENGIVENRVIEVPMGMPGATLVEAGNYLAARLIGRTLDEAGADILAELDLYRAELDALTKKVVEAGLATWAGERQGGDGLLIVRGQANLLEDVTVIDDLERIRTLFDMLERKEAILRLLNATSAGEGVQIFIGAENELFSLAGCSVVLAPLRNGREQVVGAVGVIGPTRINYARIIPAVDYTARVVGRLMG